MAIVIFPRTQRYDRDPDIVIFFANVREKTISCSISGEALRDHFQGDLLKPLQALICSRPAIGLITERLIANRRFDADGCSVLIHTADC
jgi:hypothetical protein